MGPLSSGHLYPSSGKQKSLGEDPRLYHPHYELTKVLSLEVPQPSGSASSYGVGCNNAPSPKPSPGKQRSPPKKKMSSSSPGEREGYYPCNRCGRYLACFKIVAKREPFACVIGVVCVAYLNVMWRGVHRIESGVVECLSPMWLPLPRVFTKVKSRSAHMKSHIIKQS